MIKMIDFTLVITKTERKLGFYGVVSMLWVEFYEEFATNVCASGMVATIVEGE